MHPAISLLLHASSPETRIGAVFHRRVHEKMLMCPDVVRDSSPQSLNTFKTNPVAIFG